MPKQRRNPKRKSRKDSHAADELISGVVKVEADADEDPIDMDQENSRIPTRREAEDEHEFGVVNTKVEQTILEIDGISFILTERRIEIETENLVQDAPPRLQRPDVSESNDNTRETRQRNTAASNPQAQNNSAPNVKNIPSPSTSSSRTRKTDTTTYCAACDWIFPHRSGKTAHHKAVHVNEFNFVCHICKKRFKSKNNQRQHMLSHAPKKLSRCTLCFGTFDRPDLLARHMKRNHQDKQKQKSHKARAVRSRISRTGRHKRRKLAYVEPGAEPDSDDMEIGHKTRKPDTSTYCAPCDRTFPQRSGKTAHHKAVHLNEFNFSCDICKKLFKSKNNQRQHMLTHAPKKLSECTECGATFDRPDLLNRHIYRNHQLQQKQTNKEQRDSPCPQVYYI